MPNSLNTSSTLRVAASTPDINEQTDNDSKTVVQQNLEQTMDALAESLNKVGLTITQTVSNPRNSMVLNSVVGQVTGLVPQAILANTTMKSVGASALLKGKASPFESNLAQQYQEKVGLFRAANINESGITNYGYNLAMVKETLQLGYYIRQQLTAKTPLHFETLWGACRDWRQSRLAAQSSPEQLVRFGSPRLRQDTPTEKAMVAFTKFYPHEVRYGHLFNVLEARATRAQAGDKDALSGMVKGWGPINNVKMRIIAIQHSLQINGQDIPLTEIQSATKKLKSSDKDPWGAPVDSRNVDIDQFSNEPIFLMGEMTHTDPAHLDALENLVQEKINQLHTIVSENNTQPKNTAPIKSVKQLAEIHYLLAHAMFDRRGSAAKSELLIRSLAIGIGFELPPFKKGFMPDLEAFVCTPDEFVNNYIRAFTL